MSNTYEKQARGDGGAYERYLRGMDSSMKQKVALTAAHMLAVGSVADMGMGSGTGSDALAALYPSLQVTGVDISDTMVELAAKRFIRPNLRFVQGDIAAAVFPPESLDAIFDSSVLHHVTTFSGYDYTSAERALQTQVSQLRSHGVLIVRDFVDPGRDEVHLELPANDGDASDDVRHCSTATLFIRFASEFRKLATGPGFPYREVEAKRDGFRCFALSRKLAAEFVLRKDYRADWETEVLEEYTYFTQAEFEQIFSRLGMRIVASTPLWNPWIVRHRYDGKFFLTDAKGQELEPPPTNYLIAGERVAPGEGVRFEETVKVQPLGFLSLTAARDARNGTVRDLVRRPHATIDAIPWFRSGDEIYVVARKSYPRAILSCGASRDTPSIDGSTTIHYLTEPLTVLQRDEPLGRTVEASLAQQGAIGEAQIRSFLGGCVYYPSPGGIEEEVRSALVEIEPVFAQRTIANVSGFATSGHVRPIEATQILRAAQAGGLSEARLELNVYRLLHVLGHSPGPWIGDAIAVEESGIERGSLSREPRRVFEPSASGSKFLELRCSTFHELAADDASLASQALEYVVPASLSVNTIAVALLTRSRGEVLIGIDDDDLPAAQSFTGNSNIAVAPAWRLPRELTTRRDAKQWIAMRLQREYGLLPRTWFELGGKYHPSPGVTPERVFPYAIDVKNEGTGERQIAFLPLAEVIRDDELLRDGHLRIVAFRAAHALGLL